MSEDIFLSIAAPVFNEEDNIEEIVRYWDRVIRGDKINAEIVLTNDGSTDNTLKILEELKRELPYLNVVSYSQNKGYGMALSSSIRASRGKYILTIDSDGQFDVAEYKILLEELEKGGFDLVSGFRMGKKDSLFKIFCDRVLNLVVKLLFGIKLRDTNCALKLSKGELLKKIDIEATGYPTPTEIIIKLYNQGIKISEVGITHSARKKGTSKLRPIRTGINMFKFLFYIRLKEHLYRERIIKAV